MRWCILALLVLPIAAHTATSQSELWANKYGNQVDMTFSGPLSFSHLPYERCLDTVGESLDIAILGMPFDTTTSYRPGARFGPFGIRAGSRRQRALRGHSLAWGFNPYTLGLDIKDCGDVPVNPFSNALAMDQMEAAYMTLLQRPVSHDNMIRRTRGLALDSSEHPRIVTLGGDHTVVLPILRALNQVYGPVSVIHFDAHLDTWPSTAYGQQFQHSMDINHGTFFWVASSEGLIRNNSVHVGIRCKFSGIEDIEHDSTVGFALITTDDIDDHGPTEIIRRIRQRIGSSPVYLSLDIDVLDPAFAPATGTPEAGGYTTRELKRILRGLAGLNIVGADVVEVAPAYDTNAEVTTTVAADLVHDFISLLLADEPSVKSMASERRPRDEL